jgi:stalled ribosome alternative rescue factor ArfA
MKPISFVLQAPRQRRHQALFDQDLPFRGRVERAKTVYTRKAKHPNRGVKE